MDEKTLSEETLVQAKLMFLLKQESRRDRWGTEVRQFVSFCEATLIGRDKYAAAIAAAKQTCPDFDNLPTF